MRRFIAFFVVLSVLLTTAVCFAGAPVKVHPLRGPAPARMVAEDGDWVTHFVVENVSELGSGIPAGLSSTVLSVFDEFRYDRIDLRIALDGERAQIDGLARPDGGYYLVKGAGLPRIDVIGRNRSVAWKELVERLRQIRVEGAQVK